MVNMGNGTLVAGGKPVMCESKESPELMSVCHVSSTDAIIPGQCQLHLLVSHSKQSKCSGALEPAIGLMEHQGLLIFWPICSMEEGSSIIRVLNPPPAPVAVYSNQTVGILQPLSLRPWRVWEQQQGQGTDDIQSQRPIPYRERAFSLFCSTSKVLYLGDPFVQTDVVWNLVDQMLSKNIVEPALFQAGSLLQIALPPRP